MDRYTEWVLGGAIAALGWFVQMKVRSYDKKHEDHYKAIGELKEASAATTQQMQDHEKMFNRIEAMCAEIRQQLLHVLKAVNGRT